MEINLFTTKLHFGIGKATYFVFSDYPQVKSTYICFTQQKYFLPFDSKVLHHCFLCCNC